MKDDFIPRTRLFAESVVFYCSNNLHILNLLI
jgi:hypothetical protein